jgi:dTDP-4-dehydrorhamnose 3,5-epimerase
MLFHETPLRGAYWIELEKRGDSRGFFARAFCTREFESAGLAAQIVQANNSFSATRGTLRGLHYQLPPSAEVKIVRCIRGALFDLLLDLRPDSPTYGKSYGTELSDQNRRMMYVPQGFAHAMLTLADDTEALYFTTEFYDPSNERGVRWNDPHFDIQWPIEPVQVSDKDGKWPDFAPDYHGVEKMRGLL